MATVKAAKCPECKMALPVGAAKCPGCGMKLPKMGAAVKAPTPGKVGANMVSKSWATPSQQKTIKAKAKKLTGK